MLIGPLPDVLELEELEELELELLLELLEELVLEELEDDDDIARVVDRPQHPVRSHACVLTCLAESVEGGRPGREIGDRVLDVEGGHRRNVRPGALCRYPRKLGFARPSSGVAFGYVGERTVRAH